MRKFFSISAISTLFVVAVIVASFSLKPLTARAIISGPAPKPVVTTSFSPTTVVTGNSATLTWTISTATGCIVATNPNAFGATYAVVLYSGADWPYGGALTASNGTYSAVVGGILGPGTYNYGVLCRNVSGSPAAYTMSYSTLTVVSPTPTASLTVSPNTVDYGGRPTLTWSSTNATSCTPGGPWTNSGTLSGSGWTDPLYSNTTFTFQCTGPGGTTPLQSVTVAVNPPVAPTASLSASPLTVVYGGQSTLTWGSSGQVTSCTAGGPWSNSGTFTGSGWTNPLYANTTFTFQCTGPGGTSYPLQSVTVNVIPPPTASLSASPTAVGYGGQSTLTWSSTNATSCTAGGPWSNSGTLSGSGWTNPLYANTTFTFQCTGPSGTSPLQSATVTVPAPINGACGSASGVTYTYGATNYTPYSQCSSGSPSSTAFPAAGSSISWTCSGTNGGASSGSCSASQSAPVPSVSVSANPTSVPLGGSSTVTWYSSNTTSCTASGTDSAWLGAKALSGSQVFNNLTAGLHTYTLGCSGPGGSGSGSATVNVASFACGNGTCETGENLLTCPTDCKVKVQQF